MLVKIWAKILAVDPVGTFSLIEMLECHHLSSQTCQSDLIKDGSHRYFLAILSDPYVTVRKPGYDQTAIALSFPSSQPNERTMAAFVLATIVNNYPQGQASSYRKHQYLLIRFPCHIGVMRKGSADCPVPGTAAGTTASASPMACDLSRPNLAKLRRSEVGRRARPRSRETLHSPSGSSPGSN